MGKACITSCTIGSERFDDAGNLLSQVPNCVVGSIPTMAYDAEEQLSTLGSTLKVYDAEGRRVVKGIGSSPAALTLNDVYAA